MKKILVLCALSLCVFSSCILDGSSSEYISSIGGKAANATTQGGTHYWTGLQGASITLKNNRTGETYTTSVDSSGGYTFYSIKSGDYRMSGAKPGYTFIPRTVHIGSYDTKLPAMLAYPYNGSSTDIYIVAEWVNPYYDVGANIVRETIDSVNATLIEKIGPGFGTDPENKIEHAGNNSSGSDGRPLFETFKITGMTGKPYEELRYYLRLKSPGGSLTGGPSDDAAGILVYIMQGNTCYGAFSAAQGTSERVLHIITFRKKDANVWEMGSSGGGWISGYTEDLDQIRSVQNPAGTVVIVQ